MHLDFFLIAPFPDNCLHLSLIYNFELNHIIHRKDRNRILFGKHRMKIFVKLLILTMAVRHFYEVIIQFIRGLRATDWFRLFHMPPILILASSSQILINTRGDFFRLFDID